MVRRIDLTEGLYLTSSDDDGIFLHFSDGERTAGVKLDRNRSDIWQPTANNWADKLLENHKEI